MKEKKIVVANGPAYTAWLAEKKACTVASMYSDYRTWKPRADRASWPQLAVALRAALNEVAIAMDQANMEFKVVLGAISDCRREMGAASSSEEKAAAEARLKIAQKPQDERMDQCLEISARLQKVMSDGYDADLFCETVETISGFMKTLEVPVDALGIKTLEAALGDRQFDKITGQERRARMFWMAQRDEQGQAAPNTVAQAFWDAWMNKEKKGLLASLEDRQHDAAGWWLGSFMNKASKDATLLQAAKPIIDNLASVFEWGKPSRPWATTGWRAASTLKYAFPRFTASFDPMFGLLPDDFWVGLKREVGCRSKMGAWILEKLIPRAKANPQGILAGDLCALAWSTLDRKEIALIEGAIQGIGEMRLAELASRSSLSFKGDLSDLSSALKNPQAKWTLAFFAKKGAPTGPNDLDYDGPLADWIRKNPQSAIAALQEANASLNAKKIKKAMKQASLSTAVAATERADLEGLSCPTDEAGNAEPVGAKKARKSPAKSRKASRL